MTKLLNKKGFTLIELMVVIVIVGILAAVAIPKFTHASHKAKCSEVPTNLMAGFTALGTYFQETQTYVGATFTTIGLQDPTTPSKWFTYSIPNPGASEFTVRAVADAPGFGAVQTGNTVEIDESQNKTKHANYNSYLLTWTN